MPLRARLYRLFEGWDHPGARTSWVDWCLIVLIIANVAAVTMESIAPVYARYETAFDAFEIFSVTVFAIEYGFRVWLCVEDPARRGQGPVMARLRYMLTPLALIDLAAFLPVLIAMVLGVGPDLRMLRVIRVMRILKLARYSIAIQTINSVFQREKRTLFAAFVIVVIAIYLSATAAYLAEHKAQPDAFGSIPQAMWWALATLTTVGYGDVVPRTDAGRIIGAFVMVSGIGLFVMWTGIFASSFSQEMRRRSFRITFEMVARVPAFRHLEAYQISAIAQLLKPLQVPERYMIVRRGEPANAMYFIVEGLVEVEVEPEPVELEAGNFFGETGILHEGVFGAAFIAIQETSLLVLDRESFEQLIETHEDVRRHIVDVADARQHWLRSQRGSAREPS